MKKRIITSLVILLTAFYIIGTAMAATTCNLEISIINQDPYPAIPGDSVKVVFQIDGLENTQCGLVTFGIKEGYPFSLDDPTVQNPITIKSGTYQKDYGSFYLAPYKLRVDENTLNGENPIEIYYSTSEGATNIIKEFNITVEDTRADFEIHVKNYDYATRELTFEILNIEKVDVKALTLEIPKQTGIEIKGSNRIVIGDLDSNEYTTADFEAILPDGKTDVNLNIIYTDSINVRREIQKVVNFDSSYFTGREIQKKKPWFLIILVVAVIAFFVWRRIKKNKREKERMKKRGMM
jgi:hypothetical protein